MTEFVVPTRLESSKIYMATQFWSELTFGGYDLNLTSTWLPNSYWSEFTIGAIIRTLRRSLRRELKTIGADLIPEINLRQGSSEYAGSKFKSMDGPQAKPRARENKIQEQVEPEQNQEDIGARKRVKAEYLTTLHTECL